MLGTKKNLKLNNIKFDNRYLFIVVLLVIFALEIFVIQGTVAAVWSLENQAGSASQQKNVRIDFANYDNVVGHINNADSFVPDPGINKNPFNSP